LCSPSTASLLSLPFEEPKTVNPNKVLPMSPDKSVTHVPGLDLVLQAPGGTEYLDVLDVSYQRISVEPFREPPGSESSSKGPPRRPIPTDEG
jgi:hypothetical protein